jgi:hypothetical protein
MWCPSVSLSVWTNAWLAGQASPDDVLDALSAWAAGHSVTAYDASAAGRTGLPWPDVDRTGPMSLLQTVRTAAGGRPGGDCGRPSPVTVVLPVPGDVRGLEPGTAFARDALDAGEAVVVSGADGRAVGLVPALESDGPAGAFTALAWSAHTLQNPPRADPVDLGDAEYALRRAVRSAAETLRGLEPAAAGEDDPRSLVAAMLAETSHHRIPDHAPARAVRALATAAQVDAIVSVSAGAGPAGLPTALQARIADEAIRPLSSVVRTARAAALDAILRSAWRS